MELLFFLKEILHYLKPFWKKFLLALFFAILSSLLTGFSTWAIKPIFNYVFMEKHYEYFKFIPIFIITVFTLIGGFSLL
ncbi:MAG: hypothetical protein C0169_03465, partial [Thermodesulfobacterium geofontis]